MRTLRFLQAIAGGFLAFVLLPCLAQAQQTGSLLFDVSTPTGQPVAGARIAISSDKVPGQERVTDQFGKARFLLLPPGVFRAEVTAEGHNKHVEEGIDVGLGQRVNVSVKLQPVLEESMDVTVASEASVADVNVTQTKTSSVMSAKQLEAMQLGSGGRSYLAAVGKTAGVVGGGGNPSVHGATLGENIYTIDGVNTTDPVTGTFGLLTNFDIIEQLEVSTGGFQAEFGGATGGIINQITKSGTNEFSGSLDIRRYDEGLRDSSPHFQPKLSTSFEKYSGTLTGPVVKDKLWFALSYEKNETETTPAGSLSTRAFEGEANLAKLTWEPAAGHRVSFQFTEDPAEIANANAGVLVDPTATRFQQQGAEFYKINYTGQVTDNWAITAQAGWYESTLDSYPMVDSGLPGVTNDSNGYTFQNYTNAQFSTRSSDQYMVQLQRGWSGSKGDHLLKFGYEEQRTGLDFRSYTPGGETWTTVGGTPDPTFLDADNNGDGVPDNVYERVIATDAQPSTNPGRNHSLYVQDTWRRGKFTWDYGIRWDRATADRDDGKEVVDVSLIQPRLGMAMDIKGDGRQKFHWSLTRRMHPGILTIPNAVNTRAGTQDVYYNEVLLSQLLGFDFDIDNDTFIENEFVYYGTYGGPSGTTVDPDLDPTYVDEVIVGYERRLRSSMRFASRLIVNETNDIIEDTEFPAGSGQYAIRNLPELRREYKGIELEYGWLHRRGQFSVVTTIAQAKGNVEYTQGLGTDFDVFDVHYVNRYGYLSTDAKLRIRVFGYVDLPKKFQIGYDLNYRTGVPYNRTRSAQPYGVQFLEPRGSRRLSSLYTLDVEFRKFFDFGKSDRVRLSLIGSILNLTNANAVTAKQTNDPRTNSRFGADLAWQSPRQMELGLRLTF